MTSVGVTVAFVLITAAIAGIFTQYANITSEIEVKPAILIDGYPAEDMTINESFSGFGGQTQIYNHTIQSNTIRTVYFMITDNSPEVNCSVKINNSVVTQYDLTAGVEYTFFTQYEINPYATADTYFCEIKIV